ncbi:hypothetical protein K474DRAFT_617657 [Panus rudis PR-1116 ss-1]|nr:hypothetical protein K474DRAFT_617657 [Panus rudis PR-1116 ss-1]
MKSQETRLSVYREMETTHDQLHLHNEEKRMSVFTQTMTRRESEFQRAHDEHLTRASWYAEKRAQVFEQGRKRRDGAYDAVPELAREVFEKVMKDAEREFFEAKGEREKRISEKLEELREALPVASKAAEEYRKEVCISKVIRLQTFH